MVTGGGQPLALIQGLNGSSARSDGGFPWRKGAMVLGLSLSFFPLLIQEANEITIAQRARGVTFKKQWWKRMTGLLAMVVPLFVNSLRRSLEVAQAMEARGYRPGEPCGSLYELKWEPPTLCMLDAPARWPLSGLLPISYFKAKFAG